MDVNYAVDNKWFKPFREYLKMMMMRVLRACGGVSVAYFVAFDLSFRVVIEVPVALESTFHDLAEFLRKCRVVE